ncbi:MAG: hypothetical protein VB141_06925, partial [Burkholderia gladioli]
MRVRVLSDLHLEGNTPEAIPGAAADLVVLAGDIHNHAEGLRWAAETFPPRQNSCRLDRIWKSGGTMRTRSG